MEHTKQYKYVVVEYVNESVLEVRMNRADKRNAMNMQLWKEIGHCFTVVVPLETRCRCVILTGAGKIFSAGIDLQSAMLQGVGEEGETQKPDVARRAIGILREGGSWQNAWKSINTCTKPVIAAVQGGCYGAALEMISFCDIRFCTQDAVFQAPEVDIGLAADIGGNQMLPKVIANDSLLRELQMSGRKLTASEALSFGLVSRILKDEEDLMNNALEMANAIASKSPIAVMGIKTMLNYTRDHSVDDSLKYGLTWNAAMVQSEDIKTAGMSFAMKKTPTFSDAPTTVEKSKL